MDNVQKVEPVIEPGPRDHLFISYATEDKEFVRWLTLVLTRDGYRVWSDEFKLLGGESYPSDIGDAINNRSFRFLAVISRSSLDKPNPVKERTLALSIAGEREIDFLIPLNLDGLLATQIPWMVSDITYIPFHKSWAEGLNRLKKKLESINCPRPLKNGKAIVAGLRKESDVLLKRDERVFTNLLKTSRIPRIVKRFSTNSKVTYSAAKQLAAIWPCYHKDNQTLLSFFTPSDSIREEFTLVLNGEEDWTSQSVVFGIPSVDVAKHLIEKSLWAKCQERGLVPAEYKAELLYFPEGLVEGDVLRFNDARGKATWVNSTGVRMSRRNGEVTQFRYALGTRLQVRYYPEFGYCAHIFVDVHTEGLEGEELPARSRFSKSRGILKGWYNRQLLNRQLAIVSYLSDNTQDIVFGAAEEQLVLSAESVRTLCDRGVALEGDKTDEAGSVEKESSNIIDEEETEMDSEDGGVDD